MRLRRLVLSAIVLATAAGAAGCSASGAAPAAAVSTGTSAAGSATMAGPAAGATGGSSVPGTMMVRSGGKVVCVMTIKAGKGTCKVNTAQFAAGNVKFTGTYNGRAGSKPATATATLKLRKAPTTTRLSLAAGTVTYGHEQSERLTVRVVPRFSGAPAGTVTVRAGSTVVCAIKLASGAGSCTLSASKLAAGSYQLVARYPGSVTFVASASAKLALSVSK
ncbi:MAG TPA: Ig-like domain-containing protein [Trebonia sp.]|nr:Ig-like domain-containing protein [Trebonia sp.]